MCYCVETWCYRRLSLKPQIKWTQITPGPRQKFNKIYPTHAYVGNYYLNYMPIQDDDSVINHGDKYN